MYWKNNWEMEQRKMTIISYRDLDIARRSVPEGSLSAPRQFSIPKNEEDELKNRNYVIYDEIGKGGTSTVYRGQYRKGRINRPKILKRLRPELNPEESVTTVFNLLSRDVFDAAISFGNEFSFTNLAEITDAFEIDGVRWTVEEEYWARDLEKVVETDGPIRDEKRLYKMTSDLIETLGYLHGKGIIHRDIKPSNILMNREDHIFVIDWQNAVRTTNCHANVFPTSGCRAYATPELLNATMQENSYKHTFKDDMHALASTLYFVMIGKPAFDYHIVLDQNGRKLKVAGRDFPVSLTRKGEKVEEISEAMYQEDRKRLRGDMKAAKVPRRWRKLLDGAWI
jgi:serine/threonine protein kinase